jgi:glycosyltransferase involved in cell wall biosynthesis
MKNPRVSVIIPTYNRAYFLPRAVKSVLAQTFQDFELIVVDDGSTDDTKKTVKEFQKKDKRIKYIWQENSGRPAVAKNTGIKAAQGRYIAFLDDDDEWLPEKLEKQLKLFNETKNLGVVGCNCWNVYENKNNKKREYRIKKNANQKSVFSKNLERCFIHSSSSVIIPRRVFDAVGLYDESLNINDDWDLYIRILKNHVFDFAGEPLFCYYIHDKNISGDASCLQHIEDLTRMLDKHKKDYDDNLLAKSRVLVSIGTYYMVKGDRVKARRYFFESVRAVPLLRNYLNLIISFFGQKTYELFRKGKKKLSSVFCFTEGYFYNEFI